MQYLPIFFIKFTLFCLTSMYLVICRTHHVSCILFWRLQVIRGRPGEAAWDVLVITGMAFRDCEAVATRYEAFQNIFQSTVFLFAPIHSAWAFILVHVTWRQEALVMGLSVMTSPLMTSIGSCGDIWFPFVLIFASAFVLLWTLIRHESCSTHHISSNKKCNRKDNNCNNGKNKYEVDSLHFSDLSFF